MAQRYAERTTGPPAEELCRNYYLLGVFTSFFAEMRRFFPFREHFGVWHAYKHLVFNLLFFGTHFT
jgi:hypothetical protein